MLNVEQSGKVAANIMQLIAELHRQIKEQSHEYTTEFRVVIDSKGAHVSQTTTGPEFLRATGQTAVNLRGEVIA
ncbi:hypothetical protein KDW46_02300 [Burkholderia vietnamiensis]|nr:hypothetical protein [Burkholderia vietnamiensis]